MPNDTQAPADNSGQGTTVETNPFEMAPPSEGAQQTAQTQVATPPASTQAPAQPTQQTQPPQATQPQQPVQQPQQAVQPSQQDIGAQITAGILAARQAEQAAVQQQQQQQPLTEQEFAQRFGIPTIDAAGYEAMFGAAPATPQALQALNNLQTQTIRSAVLMAEAIVKKELGAIRGQIEPLSQAHVRAMEERYTNDFYQRFPDLKDEGPLLKEIRDAAVARGMKFNTIDEAFNFAATQARTILKRVGTPANGAQQQPQHSVQQPKQPTRTMTPTSMGGRSGSTGSGQSVKSTSELVFGS